MKLTKIISDGKVCDAKWNPTDSNLYVTVLIGEMVEVLGGNT